MASMKNFVDINALVARCCWQASGGDMEGEAFLEECIALKEGMAKMKERYMNLIYDREYLLMVSKMYHSALKKEEEKLENITNKLEITSNLLKSTQRSLQDSKLQIFQFQKEIKVSHLSYCMEGSVLGIMEEPHVEDSHEGGADLQVLVKIYKEENLGQALIDNERKDEVSLSLINMAEQIPYGSENKSLYSSIDWVDRNIFGMKNLGGKEFYYAINFTL